MKLRISGSATKDTVYVGPGSHAGYPGKYMVLQQVGQFIALPEIARLYWGNFFESRG
jgi:hypothetical protein